jgi:hypothetical protein
MSPETLEVVAEDSGRVAESLRRVQHVRQAVGAGRPRISVAEGVHKRAIARHLPDGNARPLPVTRLDAPVEAPAAELARIHQPDRFAGVA